ncbi:DUF4912 domain-containing protein [Candidatus Ruminimicrobium bovinum]|uniref:DUF4912 domain-containing protein n=1 Tax=Candidatus Ruminimicrobium bovinum TaxID=3242779 RepID=UPI0039B98ABB
MVNSFSSKLENKTKPVNKLGLPKDYGDTAITILPKDPVSIFAYWSINRETKKNLESKYGNDFFKNSKLVIRIYDMTDDTRKTGFDVFIDTTDNSYYINVGKFNRSWVADIGYITSKGKFISVAKSNILNMPKYGISAITDEQWVMLESEFEKILKTSNLFNVGTSSLENSKEISKIIFEKWKKILSNSLPSSQNVPNSMAFVIKK